MKEGAKVNAMRSGVIVIGALAFGYLSLQLGFKPYLERAQQQQEEQSFIQKQHQLAEKEEASQSSQSFSDYR